MVVQVECLNKVFGSMLNSGIFKVSLLSLHLARIKLRVGMIMWHWRALDDREGE